MARIVLNTFGSLGDLHPYLAIAIELRRRGHDVVIATSEVYRQKILAEGIDFAPVRPDVGLLMHDSEFIKRLWHPQRGSEFLLRDYLIPYIEQSYEDLRNACKGANLLLTHVAGLAGPIVAEALSLPWLSVALQPAIFFSKYDPPVIAGMEWVRHLYPFGPGLFQALMGLMRLRLKKWARPVDQLKLRVGLSVGKSLLESFSPSGTVALFSESFATSQPDWPPHTHVTGFVYYDQLGAMPNAGADDPSELDNFLRSGPPPVLFTLGSAAVMDPGDFFRESIVAAHALGVRAVLLAGPRRHEIHNPLPNSILIAGYVPFSRIMPRSAAIVHQGGIGTTAQGLRAGRPMLVAPWSHDQPDNAERLRRLGVARIVPRHRYYAPRVSSELRVLLTDPTYEQRARETATAIAAEQGDINACDVIEAKL